MSVCPSSLINIFTYIYIHAIYSIAFVCLTYIVYIILQLAFVNQHCISEA